MEKFATSNSLFALQIFQKIANDGQSAFLSPASIITALAMTYSGADGVTKTQMNDVIFHDLSDKEIMEGMQKVINCINTPVDGYTLRTASRLYAEKQYQILQSFLDVVQKYYNSDCISCDFAKDAVKTSNDINKWVEETTSGKIKNLIPPNLLTPLTRLVLVNAIYFKGEWKKEFDEKCTTKQPFHVTADQSKDVDMMHLKMKQFRFTQDDNCQVLGIEYKSPDVVMYFVLPKKRYGLHELEQSLNGAELVQLIQETRKSEVEVDLPKFKLESEYDLKNPFKQLGCTDMFEGADFSKISGAKDLSVSNIVHKAYIEVHEKGAEAAAATGIVMKGKCGNVPREKLYFKADHPFLFAIVERTTMTILFLGHYFG